MKQSGIFGWLVLHLQLEQVQKGTAGPGQRTHSHCSHTTSDSAELVSVSADFVTAGLKAPWCQHFLFNLW